MPTPNQILDTLTTIANDAIVAAVLWHLAIAVALVWLGSGWRPTSRTATALLAAPLISVAAFALAYDNPFNGLVFIASVLVLLVISATADVARVEVGPAWAAALGVAMIAYAWVYPHFLQTGSPFAYLYAAPVGLVPCPSLALVIGLALVGGGVDRRAAGMLAILGLAYGLMGAAILGVALDIGLIAGAAGLCLLVILDVAEAHGNRNRSGPTQTTTSSARPCKDFTSSMTVSFPPVGRGSRRIP